MTWSYLRCHLTIDLIIIEEEDRRGAIFEARPPSPSKNRNFGIELDSEDSMRRASGLDAEDSKSQGLRGALGD